MDWFHVTKICVAVYPLHIFNIKYEYFTIVKSLFYDFFVSKKKKRKKEFERLNTKLNFFT